MRLQSLILATFLTTSSIHVLGQGGQKQPVEGETETKSILIPEVGKPMPYFKLDNVKYYKKKQVDLNEFKGKWLVLDFWFAACKSCIASFPKANAIQKRFAGDVQYILVGQNGERTFRGNGIEDLYEKLRLKDDLQLASAFDSVLAHKWKIYAMPYIIIVSPNGIVKAITTGANLTGDKIGDLINGEVPYLSFAGPKLLFDGGITNPSEVLNGQVYRTILVEYNREEFIVPHIDYMLSSKRYSPKSYKASGATLYQLYNVAYLGRPFWMDQRDSLYKNYYPFPVLEISDSSLFLTDGIRRGLYNYSQTPPQNKPITREILMRNMQSDLANVFGYTVNVEKRLLPVWKLKAVPGGTPWEKLKTNGEPSTTSTDKTAGSIYAGVSFRNIPIERFAKTIRSILTYKPLNRADELFYNSSTGIIPLFNETGITGNIDIKLDGSLLKYENLKNELRKYDLDLVMEEKEIKVLIISDGSRKK